MKKNNIKRSSASQKWIYHMDAMDEDPFAANDEEIPQNSYHKFKIDEKFDGKKENHELWMSKFVSLVNQCKLTEP